MSKDPRLTICVGGGGVGKTTTSSALALRLARGGARTLVMTVDPARRLADALGVKVGQETMQAHVCPRAEGRLWAKMPDPRSSMVDFMEWLFLDPVQRERFKQNPAYIELADSLAGVHEVLTLALLQNEIDSGKYDEVVLDTAPSRHALGFLAYPSRLLELLEAKALEWLSAAANLGGKAEKRSIFSWGRSKVEGLFGQVLGTAGVHDLSMFFAELVSVRQRWADLSRRTDTFLHGEKTRYFIVGAPTGGAMADVMYLTRALERRKQKPAAIVLNRAERDIPASELAIATILDSRPGIVSVDDERAIRATLTGLSTEHHARAAAADEATRRIHTTAPRGTALVRLPYVGPRAPNEIVLSLADAWEAAGY